ncbi:MAG: YciI family protein [Mangrovibacterium sp.]
MFIIDLTYKESLERIDQLINEHIAFLDEQYELGNFLASGRKVPRTGGVILAKVADLEEVKRLIAQDPFQKNKLADYKITEFIPSKTSKELSFLRE